MYARLKQVMRDHGYNVTADESWNNSDTTEFQVFSRMVLGVPVSHPNHVLGYPHSFPQLAALMNADEAAVPSMPAPASAPIEPPVNEQPAATDAAPESAPVSDPNVIDVGGGSTEPDAPTDDTPPADDTPADDVPADEGASAGDDIPADDTPPANDAPADDNA